MKEALFQEFEEVSAKQWKQKIQFDLKGADYNEKLIYHSPDGIDVKPFYTSEDVQESIKTPSPKDWSICEKIYVISAEKANERAKYVLEKGAESLWFIIPSEEIAAEELLKGLDLENTPVYINFQFLSEEYFKRFRDFLEGKKAQIYLQTDIIGKLARSGNWFHNLTEDHRLLDEIVKNSAEFESVISIDTTVYQNSGATIPQQLAYALAHVNEYMNHFKKQPEFGQFQPQFLIASGSNYFFEIAKIRAFRWLYATLAKEYRSSGNLPYSRPAHQTK